MNGIYWKLFLEEQCQTLVDEQKKLKEGSK